MKFRVVVLPQAEDDPQAIFEWIAEQSPTAAVRWHRALFARIERLRMFPLGFWRAPEAARAGTEIHQIVHGSYRVLFHVEGAVVRILHVRHGARRRLGEEE